MGFTRQLLKDRSSASAIALLIACLLVVQSLLGLMAQSAMAASAADPVHVICTSSGGTSVDIDGLPQKKAPECPCASLCQFASASTPAILNDYARLPAVALVDAVKIGAILSSIERSLPRGLIGEPRAPPVSL